MAFSFLRPMKNMMDNLPDMLDSSTGSGGSNQAKMDQMRADAGTTDSSWLSELESGVVFDGNGVDERLGDPSNFSAREALFDSFASGD
jgi:hypothetical protein